MNYFKTDILKKEFQNFVDNILPDVLECGLCEKYSCKWHKLYLLTCNQCKDIQCSPCIIFKSTVDSLMKFLDDDGRNYFQNFVTDFFGISDTSLKKFFEVEKKPNESKVRIKTFDIKVYHKSEKSRSQVVMKTLEDCTKIQCISKRRKRSYYKKF